MLPGAKAPGAEPHPTVYAALTALRSITLHDADLRERARLVRPFGGTGAVHGELVHGHERARVREWSPVGKHGVDGKLVVHDVA